MFGLGMPELIIVLVIALLIFGRRLPEVMRSVGGGISEFKRGMHDVTEEAAAEPEKAPQKAAPVAE